MYRLTHMKNMTGRFGTPEGRQDESPGHRPGNGHKISASPWRGERKQRAQISRTNSLRRYRGPFSGRSIWNWSFLFRPCRARPNVSDVFPGRCRLAAFQAGRLEADHAVNRPTNSGEEAKKRSPIPRRNRAVL